MVTASPTSGHARTGGVGDVSGHAGTVVADAQGPTHTGGGDQNYLSVQQLIVQAAQRSDSAGRVRVRAVGTVTKEEVAQARHCFVRPTGFDQAEKAFASGLAILSGPPGSGRRTAAIRLLDDTPERPPRIRVLLPDPDDDPPFLDSDALEQGERLLLELPEVDGKIIDRVLNELSPFRDAVAQRDGRLVVVVSDGYTTALRRCLPVPVAPIQRPDPADVLGSHLSARTPAVDPTTLEDPLRSRLHACSAGEAAHLAETVARLADQPGPDAKGAPPFDELVATAMDGAARWADEVSRLIRSNDGVRQRAVLVSAAMLNGCSTDAAFEAAETLLSCTGPQEAEEQDGGLAREGFVTQLEILKVQVRDRRIQFGGLGYDTAVRNRFWDEFPDHHDTFREWVERCAQPEHQGYQGYTALDQTVVALLGQRFAEQHLRTRGAHHLLQVVHQWILGAGDAGPRSGTAGLVLGAVGEMLTDDGAAQQTRRRMREWARERPPRPVALVLVGLCEKTLALTHPPQAVVRLRHLAKHWDTEVAEQARASLRRLAARDRSLHRTLIDVVADRMARDRHDGRPVHVSDRDLLRLATDPLLLRSHGEHAPVATPRERSALTATMAADSAEVRGHAERWLTACALDPPQPGAPGGRATGSALPGRLGAVAEAAIAAERWSTLYGTVVRWRDTGPAPPSPQRRHEVAALVIGHLRDTRAARRNGTDARADRSPTGPTAQEEERG